LDKNKPKPLLLLSITVFFVRMVSIRTKNTVGARSAQCSLADIGGRERIPQAAVIKLARTAARPRGSPMVHG
jgi:hypothetical protein